jgi:ribonuclease HI
VRKGWKNSRKEEVLNRDLWERLQALAGIHRISWDWIRGHNGHAENERCDELARSAILEMQKRKGK